MSYHLSALILSSGSDLLFVSYFSPLQVIVILAADETSTTALIFALALAVSISLLVCFHFIFFVCGDDAEVSLDHVHVLNFHRMEER